MDPVQGDLMVPPNRGTNASGNRAGERLAWALLIASIPVYLFSRLFRIEEFPIYFFCDEAVHWVRFNEMFQNGWHAVDAPQEMLPAFFQNGGMLNLSLSVYVHGFVNFFAAPSVVTVRTVSALASVTAGIALALTLRRAFSIREWWSALAVSAVLPCWFLHSRTGFETVLMVSAYAWFVYFYLRYRENEPRWIFLTAVAGAATFYAYAPGQGVIAITTLLLLLADFRYHWEQRRHVAKGIGFAAVLLVPYVRFRWQHPGMLSEHLKTLGSYLVQDISFGEKLGIFVKNYLAGISPRFWFQLGADEAQRHVVPFQAHFPALLLPFALLGFLICLARWRRAPHRLVLIAMVAAPFSSAFVAPMVTRMLACVVPFVLTTVLGFDALVSRLTGERLRCVIRVGSLIFLSVASGGLLGVSLSEGKTFSTNYGLYGLQWGAQKLFREVLPPYLKTYPGSNVFISHASFNSPEVFPAFFGWKNERRVSFAILDDYLAGTVLPDSKDLVLLTQDEFAALRSHPEVEQFAVLKRVDLPSGAPGFYLGHLSLNSDFKQKMRSKGGSVIFPAWERTSVGREGVSITSSGIAQGLPTSVFNGSGDLPSKLSEPINIEIAFDQRTELRSIEIEADPGQIVTVWTSSPRLNQATVEVARGSGKASASLLGIKLSEIRVEVAAQPQAVAHLRLVRLRPIND